MTSVIFSESPAKGALHLLPKETTAISYNYTSDQLALAAHMEDNFVKVDQEDPRNFSVYDRFFRDNCYNCSFNAGYRCNSVQGRGFHSYTVCPRGLTVPEPDKVTFDVAPTIFQMYLSLSSREQRFNNIHEGKAVIQATQINNNRIKLSRNRRALANTWGSDNRICWGRNERPKSLKSMVKLFFDTRFNNDLVKIHEFFTNNSVVKQDIETNNFFRTYSTRYSLITPKADALFMLHAEDSISAFFWMISAGFKPIKEASHLMLIPLTETKLEHEGVTYSGYLTNADACGKEWFVNKNGELLGQL
jgi:hypothetical protein